MHDKGILNLELRGRSKTKEHVTHYRLTNPALGSLMIGLPFSRRFPNEHLDSSIDRPHAISEVLNNDSPGSKEIR